MSMPLPVFSVNPIAALIGGIFAQAFLQGISVVLVLAALYVLLKLTKAKERNWILVTVACANLVLSTIDISISFYYVLHIFIDENSTPESFILYYLTFQTWPNVTRVGLALTQALLGDFVLLYRTWVVWGKQRRGLLAIIVPGIFWIVCVSMCIVLVHKLAVDDYESVFAGDPMRWILSVLATTLTQNFICVSLILYKLWSVTTSAGGMQSQTSRSLWSVGSMILESGLLYCLTILPFMIIYSTDQSAFLIFEDMVSPMISITFSFLLAAGPGVAIL
ncbi:hypothetical protein CALCODRAFT_515386 [Calocera cornea HHB12733]|uniref:Fungal pheromone STE3G-protein-coupled receptor n=1 Tax=Calocera cornea HHB12733 TaxID=1353952 RepID=A0A165ICQ3_9BASI|nr:hypothetical protein CALCODRAFT_515386 [Calocera cornea HHB12733]